MATTQIPLFLKPSLKPKPLVAPLFAGRSKKKKHSGGRIEGPGEVRREAKEKARLRSKRMGENQFYRRKKQAENYADSFTEQELEMVGLGYDRFVRFMKGPDDPNLRHPYDWYKYGEFGPYSWRGIVVGPPVRGRPTDDNVTLITSTSSHEQTEEIEKFEMSKQYSNRVSQMDSELGLKHYWVFVRHPKWRPSEKPWKQWTLVAEVAIESARSERVDKWSLMARLGNQTRRMVTQCAAWERPDIIYVKKPIYQARFEPQVEFFRALGPLLDPETESNFLFFYDNDSPPCTYFQGLCKIVKANPKSYVDDVVKAYEKLDEDGKSNCLEFLLGNHPHELLHPFTKEWKLKLEDLEFGCDAPDEDEEEREGGGEVWSEGEDEREIEEEETAEEEIEEETEEEEEKEEHWEETAEEEIEEETEEEEEKEEHWEEMWEKAMRSTSEMEKLVERSLKTRKEEYRRQMEEGKRDEREDEREVMEMVEREREEREEEEERERREEREKPPGMFVKGAVRPFNYRNLVKEVVLMRHAIVDGDVCPKSWR